MSMSLMDMIISCVKKYISEIATMTIMQMMMTGRNRTLNFCCRSSSFSPEMSFFSHRKLLLFCGSFNIAAI